MSLSPEAQFIIGPQVPIADNYFDQTFLAKARQHGEACPAEPPANPDAVTIQGTTFNNHFYYDLPLSLYIAYSRTNDVTFLTLARKAADLWWLHPQWIKGGEERLFPDSATPAPRHAGIGGLILRALDGRFEMWDWINAYTRAAFNTWIKNRITGSHLHYGVREGAFALRFACWLAKVLPDSFPLQAGGNVTNGAQLRAQYLNDIEAVCVQYFGRLQYPDGSWRWNTTPDEPRDEDGGTWVGIMQPFMVGLLLRALCDAHQTVTTESVKENIKNQILKACRHLFADGAYTVHTAQNFNVQVRGFHYFFHGGTTVNPTKYERGDIPHPWLTTERWHVESARQAISTVVGSFAYAYKISGDPIYKLAGNEIYNSAYSGDDGFRSMMADTSKNFNQHIWGSSNYRAWLGEEVPEPAPLPKPAPPDPEPLPEPSDDPIPVVAITSPRQGDTVSGKVSVTSSVTNNTGIAEVYLNVDDAVIAADLAEPYTFDLDTTKLRDGTHVLYVRAWSKTGKAGDSAKISITVNNAPAAPSTREGKWPAKDSEKDKEIARQWADGYRLAKTDIPGAIALFERVK